MPKLEPTSICQVCGKECDKSDKIEHHTTYEPPVTVIVCRKCHAAIHYENYSRASLRTARIKQEGRQIIREQTRPMSGLGDFYLVK